MVSALDVSALHGCVRLTCLGLPPTCLLCLLHLLASRGGGAQITGHAYSLLNLKQTSSGLRLVQVRNPVIPSPSRQP